MIAGLLAEVDALDRLADVIHRTPTLPAVEITVSPAGEIRLHVIAAGGEGGWAVEAWAAVLGAAVVRNPAAVEAEALLGAHHVTVWAAAA